MYDDPRYPRYDRPGERRQQAVPPGGGDLIDTLVEMLGQVIFGLLKVLGRYCVEVGLVAAPVAAGLWLRLRAGWPMPAAVAAPAGVVAFLLAWKRARRLLIAWCYRRHVRRAVGDALRHIDATAFRGRPPLLRQVRRVPCGDEVRLWLTPGPRFADLDAMSDALAVALRVREVRVRRDDGDASKVTLTIVRRDPFAGPALAWPHAREDWCSLWFPIPVGVDETGEPVTITLPERNVLLGGEPGAGKSAALSLLVATAALDPSARLWLLDGKQVELAAWRGVAERSAGPDLADANDLLRQVRTVMEKRYRVLLDRGRRKVENGDGLPLHVVVVDELAFYLTHPDRKLRAEFADLLRDLVARGRAAGVIVLAATQKPSADVIPTSLRDLFGFRWALRCTTPAASDTVLGSGWASEGYSASSIDPAQRGVGWLLHEGGVPRLLKSFYLDDRTIGRIARRAEEARGPVEFRALAVDGG